MFPTFSDILFVDSFSTNIMAYPGIKQDRGQQLDCIKRRLWDVVVDAFYGSGGLTKAFLYGHSGELLIGGEAFAPLRSLYTSEIDLKELCDRVKSDINEIGQSAFWSHIRSALRSESVRYTDAEAFVVLNNLSHGNGMRHGKSREDGVVRHNIKLAGEKLENLYKRGAFINPIVLAPQIICPDWRSALMTAHGIDAIALLDPPYIKTCAIYPDEKPMLCGAPPVELAMSRSYGAIVAYNKNDLNLDFEFKQLADRFGYSVEMTVTGWSTRYSAVSLKKEATEAMWIFSKP